MKNSLFSAMLLVSNSSFPSIYSVVHVMLIYPATVLKCLYITYSSSILKISISLSYLGTNGIVILAGYVTYSGLLSSYLAIFLMFSSGRAFSPPSSSFSDVFKSALASLDSHSECLRMHVYTISPASLMIPRVSLAVILIASRVYKWGDVASFSFASSICYLFVI